MHSIFKKLIPDFFLFQVWLANYGISLNKFQQKFLETGEIIPRQMGKTFLVYCLLAYLCNTCDETEIEFSLVYVYISKLQLTVPLDGEASSVVILRNFYSGFIDFLNKYFSSVFKVCEKQYLTIKIQKLENRN